MVSAGQAHPTARRARSCGNTFQLPSCAYPRPGRPAHMHGGIRTSVQSQPVIATEAQGHRHSQWPSRTAPVHNASEPPRRWKERPGIKPRLKRQDAPAAGVPVPAHAAARGSAHSRTIETNQHSFNYDFPMRAIICSCYHEWIHVSYLRGAHIYYNCNFTFKNVLTLIYRITKTLSAEINFPCPATVGEPAVFSHLARVQYLHTAQLVGCWEQIGIRITQSVILFRVRHASD